MASPTKRDPVNLDERVIVNKAAYVLNNLKYITILRLEVYNFVLNTLLLM